MAAAIRMPTRRSQAPACAGAVRPRPQHEADDHEDQQQHETGRHRSGLASGALRLGASGSEAGVRPLAGVTRPDERQLKRLRVPECVLHGRLDRGQ